MPEFYLLFLLFSFLLFTGIKFFSLLIRRPKLEGIELSKISVVIPFRNEEQNLPQLLASILKPQHIPNEILFVNDHSDDHSEMILHSFIEEHNIGFLFSLPLNQSGKKAALNYGIEKANSRFILTLDADVVLNEGYFDSVSALSVGGLSSLPVIMKGKGFLGKLFSTEYSFFNAFNFLISSIWPISIIGANLIFDSKSIDYKEQLKSHQHLASGDDYFLLKEFRKSNLPIHISNVYQSSVETDAPKSLKAYFDQRVRWLSKSKFKMDWIDSLIGLFVFIYFIGGFAALLLAAITGGWLVFGSIFLIRLLIDALVYLNYAQKLRDSKNVLMLPFFQVIYPVLFLVVGILAIFYKPAWKGRVTG
jgi:glycosyltransferase involved in cell wall biosynthesis